MNKNAGQCYYLIAHLISTSFVLTVSFEIIQRYVDVRRSKFFKKKNLTYEITPH